MKKIVHDLNGVIISILGLCKFSLHRDSKKSFS